MFFMIILEMFTLSNACTQHLYFINKQGIGNYLDQQFLNILLLLCKYLQTISQINRCLWYDN